MPFSTTPGSTVSTVRIYFYASNKYLEPLAGSDEIYTNFVAVTSSPASKLSMEKTTSASVGDAAEVPVVEGDFVTVRGAHRKGVLNSSDMKIDSPQKLQHPIHSITRDVSYGNMGSSMQYHGCILGQWRTGFSTIRFHVYVTNWIYADDYTCNGALRLTICSSGCGWKFGYSYLPGRSSINVS